MMIPLSDARLRRIILPGQGLHDRLQGYTADSPLQASIASSGACKSHKYVSFSSCSMLYADQEVVLCSDNYIGALGAAVIANALSKNKSLRELHMKGNALGDEGVKALCKALKERQSPITSLDFGNNK